MTTVVSQPLHPCNLFNLIMAAKSKSSDDGNWDVPKRNCKVYFLSEKLKVLNLMKKEKNHILRLLQSTVRKNLLSGQL